MRSNPYQNYLDTEVLTADPLKLVVLLYRGALDSVAAARRHLASGDISARSQAITRGIEIISELIRSLDFDRGGGIAPQLGRLYEFVTHRLIEANVQQRDQPLADAEQVLATLLDGWQQCQQSQALAYAPQAKVDGYLDQGTDIQQARVSCAY